jgi:DNA polymerase-3 subunit alpha
MGSKLKFAHLHQHTQFSLLDGAAKLQDLLKWVKETTPEDPALAMTDHGNLFGAVEFYKKATAMGVKPIIGYEAYVAAESRFDRKRGKGLDGGYFHLTLLAKDFTGYQNLVRLASRAYLEGFYEKPRIDREILKEHSEGLIALSGCLGAEIPQFILQDRLDLAEARLNEYLSIFGDRFFIEIQNHGLPEQQKVNQVLKEFARKYGLGMVATNDGHYVRKEDARAHEVLLAIQSKTTLDDPERWRFPCDEFYVKTPEEMRAMLPEAEWGDEPFDNTVEIARMCDVDLPIGDKMVYRIPRFPLPEGRTEAQYLRELTFLGLLRRYPDRITEAFYREVLRLLGTMPPHGDERALAEALARVEEKAWEGLRKRLPPLEGVREWTAEAILHRALYELSVIERMGFPGYFLIVQDYINWARGHGVSVGPGRGSAAGSLVAYAVGITNIDPLRFGLLFERFLNPERVSMPDIDTDFSDRERDRVIQYVRERYGEDKVAQIGTFGSLASKAALKDVARVYGIPHKKAEELAKLIPVQFGKPKPLQEAIQVVPELRAEMEKDERIRQVIEVAMRLEGLNRHASVHAAGVVIAAEPLTDLVPLMRDQEGRPVTQYDMGAVEALGLLKMDFLGLRTLTFVDEARRIVKESKGVELDYDRLPLDDPKTFELLSRGETKGVFQLESGGMTATVRGLKPRRLEDIIALVSLYRPGPMEHIPTYIRRHHGQEPVSYAEFPHAEKYLRPILDETYGIPVYQEQIMQIASQVAGYSLGEADLLRRCLAEGSLVLDAATGQRVPIEAVKPGMEVLSLGPDYRFYRVPVLEVLESGVREVVRLRTRSGRTLVLTPDHPLLTLEGWKPLCDLPLGTPIAVPAELPTGGHLAPSEERITLLALLLGDGNTKVSHPKGPKPNAYFYSKDPELLAAYRRSAESFGARVKAYVHPTTGVVTLATSAPRPGAQDPVKRLVEEAGMVAKAEEKRVPEEVFRYKKEALALFLGCLFSTDGSVEKVRISYSSASLALVEDVAHLLLRLGIVGQVRSRGPRAHEVLISGREDILRFAEVVGPYLLGAKRERMYALKVQAQARLSGQGWHLRLVPPSVAHRISEAKGKSGFSWREAGERVGIPGNHLSSGLNLKSPRRHLSRHRLLLLGEAFADPSLKALAEGQVLWDPIVAVEPVAKARTYDLRVPPFANFVAGDLVVHNSMGKKKVEEMKAHRERFVRGAKERGVPEEEANRLFDMLEAFANYGFNKSHAAAYSLLSYQTAYVKAHYPVEFMAALLSVERHDSDKVAEYIRDARALGIPVLPPDVNRSGFDFKVVGEEILFGLSAVKNVGEMAARAILEERERGGPFKSLGDFLKRLPEQVVNKRALESLVKAGALDAFGDRARLLASLEPLLRWAAEVRERGRHGLVGLFAEVEEPPLVEASPLDEITMLRYEKEALGIYVSGHPVLRYPGLREVASCTIEELSEFVRGLPGRPKVLLSGMVEEVVRKPTRSGGMMARFTLSDETGALEMVVFGRAYEGVSPKLKEDIPLLVLAEVEKGEELKVLAQVVWTLEEVLEAPKALEVEVDHALLDEKGVARLKSLLDEHPGSLPVYLRVQGPFGEALFALREVRVGEEALGLLEAEGYRAYLVPDREVFLQGNGGGPKEEVVPF